MISPHYLTPTPYHNDVMWLLDIVNLPGEAIPLRYNVNL